MPKSSLKNRSLASVLNFFEREDPFGFVLDPIWFSIFSSFIKCFLRSLFCVWNLKIYLYFFSAFSSLGSSLSGRAIFWRALLTRVPVACSIVSWSGIKKTLVSIFLTNWVYQKAFLPAETLTSGESTAETSETSFKQPATLGFSPVWKVLSCQEWHVHAPGPVSKDGAVRNCWFYVWSVEHFETLQRVKHKFSHLTPRVSDK